MALHANSFHKLCHSARKRLPGWKPPWHSMKLAKSMRCLSSRWLLPCIQQASLPWKPSRNPTGFKLIPMGHLSKAKGELRKGLSLWNMVVSHGTSTLGSKSMIGGGSHSHRNLWLHFGGASQLKMITVWSSAPSPYRAWAPISNSHASPTWTRLAPMKPWFARKLILQQMTKEMENQPSQAPKKRRKA